MGSKPSLLLALLLTTAACGRGEPRTFHLASSNVQATGDAHPSVGMVARDLSEDVDAVAIHQDFLGVPWNSFGDGVELPGGWVQAIDEQVASAGEAPVFLSLALVGGEGRAYLADAATTAGPVSEWSALCFDFVRDPEGPRLRQAYIDYTLWMIERFQPRWLDLGMELNLYRESCDERTWESLVLAEDAIYRAVKVRHPDLVVFPSLVAETLHGLDPACEDPAEVCFAAAAAAREANLTSLSGLKMDRLALVTYPFDHPALVDPADLPADYLSAITSRVEAPLVIAATGWPAEEIRYALDANTGPCVSHARGSAEAQAAYLEWIVAEADAHASDLLTWWSNRDLLPGGLAGACSTIPNEYDCGGEPGWCALVAASRNVVDGWPGELALKTRANLGLRDHAGEPREPLAKAWRQLQRRRLRAD
ncbi:MAG: hypothetical protein P1V51_04525 [Deltaproteobacteria bacterium]|nr:hypothetical protein [Deltaproteobacteria bacterium]